MIQSTSARLDKEGWYETVIETEEESTASRDTLINYLVTVMVAGDIGPEELTERYNGAVLGTTEE